MLGLYNIRTSVNSRPSFTQLRSNSNAYRKCFLIPICWAGETKTDRPGREAGHRLDIDPSIAGPRSTRSEPLSSAFLCQWNVNFGPASRNSVAVRLTVDSLNFIFRYWLLQQSPRFDQAWSADWLFQLMEQTFIIYFWFEKLTMARTPESPPTR